MRKYLFITLLSCIPLFALFYPGLPITHDGQDHIARIVNFYNALSEGVIIPRWGQNLNWGYGHPILMFLYPFSSYTASLFHFIGFSYIDSLKIIFGIGYVASGITMYLWAKEQFDEHIGIAASLLYLFAPYRFIDLYVRGAIGEHMAFIFPPLVLFFILKYMRATKVFESHVWLTGLSVSFALLLLSHNAISLMFIPFFAIYTLYVAHSTKQYKKILYTIIFFGVGFFLSGFFTIPAFFEGKYTLRDIVTGDEYKKRFVENPLSFLYGPWNYGTTGQFSVQLGIAQLIGLILLPVVLIKNKLKEKKILLLVMLVLFVFSIFIQLSLSNFLYEVFTTFKKFQFPWRFLSLSLFTLSILSSVWLLLVPSNKKKYFVALIVVLLFVTTFSYWKPKAYDKRADAFYEGIYHGTTDTGESAPIWSVRFMENTPSAPIEVIEGNASLREIERRSTYHSYNISVMSDTSRILENTLYFPGWNILVDGKETNIQFQDPQYRGLMTFTLPKGDHDVILEFKETKLRRISNFLSILSVLFLMITWITIKFRWYGFKKR